MYTSRLPSRVEVNKIFGVVGAFAKSGETLGFSTNRIDMAKPNNRVVFIKRNLRNQNAFHSICKKRDNR